MNTVSDGVRSNLLKKIGTIADDDPYLPATTNSSCLPAVVNIPKGHDDEQLVRSLMYLTVEFENSVLVVEPVDGTIAQSVWNKVISFDVTKTLRSTNSSSNFLTLNLFVRLPGLFSASDDQRPSIEELLVGSIKVPLNLKYHSDAIRLLNHEFLSFSRPEDPAPSGRLNVSIDFKPITKKHLSIEEFDLLKVIGKGSFGKVMQVLKKDTNQIYALKTIRKQHIISRMEVTHTLAERTVLANITNPFVVPLKFSFQSPEKLYLVLAFINGGELFHHLQKEGKFSMDRSRFYIAELLSALESLHELNVIYRDLKPENILLDYQGHIALCDFGLCKLNMNNDDKTNTFCGTPEYLAPELLLNQGYTRSVDWWTLGTLLYEMLTGLPPFYDEDHTTMYRKILQNPLTFPDFLAKEPSVVDLVTKLLQKDPSKRLSDPKEIKAHAFFKDIDWDKLNSKGYSPPFKPNVASLLDTSNFDQDFTSERPQDSVVDSFLSESVQKQFGGWTYNGETVM
ncbi:Serine/threonine-protein kinase [Yamadazyma tenuis]|nr:Serine/threonine-protein kinase [Yamadazyma tenuis]